MKENNYLPFSDQSVRFKLGTAFRKLLGASKTLNTYPVRVIITGIEHSGTTLLSNLLNQAPSLSCAFECGFLLADSPQQFVNIHPWYEWMQEPVSVRQWGVSDIHMDRICSSKSWDEAYGKLIRYSPVFDHNTVQQVCDKTPRYMTCLDKVLEKLPDFVPCLVIEKDIESLWLSHKKRNADFDQFCKHVEEYKNGLRRALKQHGERIHIIKYDTLCSDLHNQLKSIFTIIDLPYKEEYTSARQGDIQNYYQKSKSQHTCLSDQELARLQILE